MLKSNLILISIFLFMTSVLCGILSFYPKEKVFNETYKRQNFTIPKNELIEKKERNIKLSQLKIEVLFTEIENKYAR